MNKKLNIPFSPPDIGEKEIEYVTEVLKSGWITTGPRTKDLEKRIAKWTQGYKGEGAPRCVCLNSATASLEMSLRILGIGLENGGSKDDEVITCAYTYTSSAAVICHVGATLKLVDCSMNPQSIEMDYNQLEQSITENTKAIIPIDLGGIPCDYDRIFEIVDGKKNIFRPSNDIQGAIGRIAIVADGAHSFGASYKDRMVGSIADFTNYSFHAVKNFTTAEGGAILWNHIDGISDEDVYHRIQLRSLHGQSKDAFAKNQLGAWEYDILGTWYKCNMTDIMAAVGQAQFERYPELLQRRKNIIAIYDEAFKTRGIDLLEHYNDEHMSSGHLYITRNPGINAEQRNEIIIKMAEAGIATNVHYKPLPMHTAYKNLGFDIKNYPNAYARFENEITLPLYSKLTDEEVQYIIDNYIKTTGKYL